MPAFISKDGVWHPQKEKVALVNRGETFTDPVTKLVVNKGDPYIYDGPCRAALYELWKIDKTGKTTTLGQDFRRAPDFIETWRKLGFKDDLEYLTYIGYDQKEAEQNFKDKASQITKHELPKRIEALQVAGGGIDTAGGGQDRFGGFGDMPKD